MFFLNGLKNIKITLTISIIFFIIISILINLNLKKTKNAQVSFVCSDHYSFGRDKDGNTAYMIDSYIYLNFCNKFKSYIDKKYENFEGISQNLKFTFIEPDNYTYLNNLAKLNEINFAKKKILSILKKNNIDNISILNSISYSISKPDFISKDYKNFDKEIKELKTLEFLRKHHIDNIEFVGIFSSIYTNVFNENNKVELFIISINILTLFILSLFIFYFFKQFVVYETKLIFFLVLFTIFNPINIFYFSSYYKEPFILMFFLGLIVNLIYLNNNSKNNHITLIFSFFFLLFLFLIILELKDNYLLPSILGLIICYIPFLYKQRSLLLSFICTIKIIALVFILFEIDTFYKLSPNNISNERLKQYFTNNIILENKNKSSSEKYFRSKDSYVNKVKIANEEYIEKSYEEKGFQNYDCKIKVLKFLCKKINSLTFRLSRIKAGTMYEMRDGNEENLIAGYKFNGVNDVLRNIPIASIKSQFMPFDIKSYSIKTLISFYKIILIIFSAFFIYKLIRSEKKHILYISILIFIPLVTTVDLISSNFFTYFRYAIPYNLVLSMIAILGFLSLLKKNDKYLY